MFRFDETFPFSQLFEKIINISLEKSEKLGMHSFFISKKLDHAYGRSRVVIFLKSK